MIKNFLRPPNLAFSASYCVAGAAVAGLVLFVVVAAPVLRYVNGQPRTAR